MRFVVTESQISYFLVGRMFKGLSSSSGIGLVALRLRIRSALNFLILKKTLKIIDLSTLYIR